MQRGDSALIPIKTPAAGPTSQATVLLRNATGDGVVLHNSRINLKDTPIAPGQVKELEFKLQTDGTLKGDELVVELMAYDADLDVQSTEKLRFKVQPSIAGARGAAEITVKSPMVIRSGASEETSVVGNAPKGASYASLGTFGPFTKVKLNAGGSKIGFLPSAAVMPGGSGGARSRRCGTRRRPHQREPQGPRDQRGHLQAQRPDHRRADVEDVYIFVSNQTAKIESRKVFYRSTAAARTARRCSSPPTSRCAGHEHVTVVARSNAQVRP